LVHFELGGRAFPIVGSDLLVHFYAIADIFRIIA